MAGQVSRTPEGMGSRGFVGERDMGMMGEKGQQDLLVRICEPQEELDFYFKCSPVAALSSFASEHITHALKKKECMVPWGFPWGTSVEDYH